MVAIGASSHVDDFVEVGTFGIVHHGAGSGRVVVESLADVALLDVGVVLTDLSQACLRWSIDLVGLVSLDRLVVDPTLVLSHQDVVLLSLLIDLDLRTQLVTVCMQGLLLLCPRLTIPILHVLDSGGCLVGKECIVLPIQLLLSLLLLHLHAKRQSSIVLASKVGLMAPHTRLRLFSLYLGHLLEHELLVPSGCLTHVSLCLIVAQSLQLRLVSQLEVLQLQEMLSSSLLVLIQLSPLGLDEHLILLL